MTRRLPLHSCLATLLAISSTGCASFGSAGPSSRAIERAAGTTVASRRITVIDLDDGTARRASEFARTQNFDKVFGQGEATTTRIAVGDVLDVVIWEAPPAALFGATAPDLRLGAAAQSAGIPQQVVGEDGSITIPFVGPVQTLGRAPSQVADTIVKRLAGRAHAPQAIVRIAQNEGRSVTVMGEVGATRRMALSPRGERVLDALASAGGSRQPVSKTTVQLTREGRSASLALDVLIRDPAQNVRLRPGDVLTVVSQPNSFVALGATGQNAEIPFEGGGISLAQALGRIGGLRDERADARGVFVFRFERPDVVPTEGGAKPPTDGEEGLPVVYRLDLRSGGSLFTAKEFTVRDRDVIYVSNAPGADLQKFLGVVSSAAFSVTGIGNALP